LENTLLTEHLVVLALVVDMLLAGKRLLALVQVGKVMLGVLAVRQLHQITLAVVVVERGQLGVMAVQVLAEMAAQDWLLPSQVRLCFTLAVAVGVALEERRAGLAVAVMVARFHQVDRTALQILEAAAAAVERQTTGKVLVGLAL
jgi:hypothetical protein